MTNHPRPDEPLTCSEVVERLAPTYAEISTFMQKFFGCDYNETHKFGFDEVTRLVYAFCQNRDAILHSWRERRVQELEEALRESDSYLSLLRHRSHVPWGAVGFPTEYEIDKVIGKTRKLLKGGGSHGE